MIKIKEINFTDGSSIDVGAIVENLQMLATEIDANRNKENTIPAGIGSISYPVMLRGEYEVISNGHPRLDITSAYCTLGDNIKQPCKVSLFVNDKKISSVKFGTSEKSGKIQIFELPDDIDMADYDTMKARISDDRRLVITVSFVSNEEVKKTVKMDKPKTKVYVKPKIIKVEE